MLDASRGDSNQGLMEYLPSKAKETKISFHSLAYKMCGKVVSYKVSSPTVRSPF